MIMLYSRWFYWYNWPMAICEDCGKQLVKTTARWCKPHGYKHRTRPTGLTYNLIKENPTSFKKGHMPWLKGTKGLVTAWNKGTKGLMKPNSGSFTSDSTSGENNTNWKGDDVGYFALHSWVQRTLGRAKICENCGKTERVQWANKSREYKREVADWLQLCYWCHRKYDTGKWGAINRIFS